MTSHGGSIVVGCPTVLIGGMPAARLSDMHVCPMVNPGPVPHVGGPITLGSTGVFIGGMPAARVGDMAVCTGPPDTIAVGCPTVLIGEVAPGGGGGGGGAGGGPGGAGGGLLIKAAMRGSLALGQRQASGGAGAVGGADQAVPDHFLNVAFTDKGGFPITGVGYSLKCPDGTVRAGGLMGGVKMSGIDPGTYEISLHAITKAGWSMAKAKIGQRVKLTAETTGIKSGEKATLEIMVRDSNFADQRLTTLPAVVKDDKIESEWELIVDEEFLKIQESKLKIGRYSAPKYYFVARTAGASLRSGLPRVQG